MAHGEGYSFLFLNVNHYSQGCKRNDINLHISCRLFLYNTCLVVCGISMALTNYFQPMMALLVSTDCSVYQNFTSNSSSIPLLATELLNTTNLTEAADLPWVCDQYNGQFLYATIYGITRSSSFHLILTSSHKRKFKSISAQFHG